jgi:hypothetical protein
MPVHYAPTLADGASPGYTARGGDDTAAVSPSVYVPKSPGLISLADSNSEAPFPAAALRFRDKFTLGERPRHFLRPNAPNDPSFLMLALLPRGQCNDRLSRVRLAPPRPPSWPGSCFWTRNRAWPARILEI